MDILDDFYSFLVQYKRENSEKAGYSNHAIYDYITVTKEFLNEEGGKIYNEDIKQKFRLPRKIHVYEKGLTKETINRIIRLANLKLGVAILISCSGGMRIGKITQLRLADVDLTQNPVTIIVSAETTKTRITHIASEAASALKDHISRQTPPKKNEDHLFLMQHEDRLLRLNDRLTKNQ